MKYEPTTASAAEFSNSGRLEEWVHTFLCNEGNNVPFSEGLKLEPRKYRAPHLMDLGLFERCCGPEDGIKFQIPRSGFDARVNAIIGRFKTGIWDMPPLIVNYNDGAYELNDGNHRYEALKKLNIKKYWVIVWETVKP